MAMRYGQWKTGITHGHAQKPWAILTTEHGRGGRHTSVGEVNERVHGHEKRACMPHGLDIRACPQAVDDTNLKIHEKHRLVARHMSVGHCRVDTMTNTRGKKTVVPISKKRKGPGATSLSATTEICHPLLQFPPGPQEELFQILRARPLGMGRCIDWATLEQLQTVMIEFDNLGTVQFRLGGLVRQLSVLEFEVALGLYTDEFMEADNLPYLQCHIHYAPSSCWAALILATGIYDPSRSNASALSPALRYLQALLAHTLIGRQESTGVVNTHDAYFLWSMSISPYVTCLARHFGLLNTSTQSSSLTLIGEMFIQGISSMLHMRMIEHRCGFDPPQYRLAQATDKDDPGDVLDDIPSFHEDPPSQPLPSHKLVHVAA
ncbi:hypothetical protein GOBAR_AA00773 [Gossypium barbadense]|uniref:Uncharacterized protein n=1 Tax=Gossypium barbadense TaxID=3634 RepID=A0A2P5YW72_GOSBA|nr:hypothetical protein GOBAR_AA00773 [Gossypium barbadense]